jgi:uncharacterized protein
MIKKLNMDLQTIIVLVITGLAAGILGGMVGVGGGIIIVPALVYFLGFSQHTAQGTSLGLILLPVGILGFIQYYNSCKTTGEPIDFKVIGLIAIGFVAGSYWGSKFAVSLPQETVKKVFAVLMILVAVKMIFFDKNKGGKLQPAKTEKAMPHE